MVCVWKENGTARTRLLWAERHFQWVEGLIGGSWIKRGVTLCMVVED